jgi:endonuclease/exonuclease/phosphatase family metal-dependent hydrolase
MMRLRERVSALALTLAFVCAGLLPCAPDLCGQGKPSSGPVLRLGSWNIENLGSPKSRRGPGEGVLQDYRDLAKYIRSARVDLLALQEITPDGPAPEGFPRKYRTSSVLTRTFNELNKIPGNGWKHILFPKAKPADEHQWTGIAWKSAKVKVVGDIVQLPVSHRRSSKGSNLWDRNVHAIMFSAGPGKTDFVVMVVHLKANTTGNFAQHRQEELKELAAKLPTLARAFPGEKDLVILGDTNMLSGQEPGPRVLEQQGFKDLNKADLDTHTAKGVQPFDRVFVPRDQTEFARSSLEVLSDFMKRERLSFREFRTRFSDHYMIVTEIRVMADDD